MPREKKAESILEFLTEKNPDIECPELLDTKTTSNPRYYAPKELRQWDEFNFDSLKTVFGGELFKEACRKTTRLPHYPHIDPEVDCYVYDEKATVNIFTKWNHVMVNASLSLIKDNFHPCMWTAGSRKKVIRKKGNPVLSTSKKQGRRKPGLFINRLKPDAGAVSFGSARSSYESPPLSVEKLPKDYKVASKWDSSRVVEEVLNPEKLKRNYLMPIRQVYTYCVLSQCRYGCILTTKEAFIFRIKPRKAPGGNCLPTRVLLALELLAPDTV